MNHRSLQHKATGIVKAAQDVIAAVTVFCGVLSVFLLADFFHSFITGV